MILGKIDAFEKFVVFKKYVLGTHGHWAVRVL